MKTEVKLIKMVRLYRISIYREECTVDRMKFYVEKYSTGPF